MSKSTFDPGLPAEGFGDQSIDVFEALANERRRHVLASVAAMEDPLGIESLARRVVAREDSVSQEAVEEDCVETVALSLYHHHLPKLADMGLLEYDDEARSVDGLTETGADLAG